MNEVAFREQLQARNLAPESVDRSVAMVRRFEAFLQRYRPAATADRAAAGDVHQFVEELARTGENTEENVLAIGRYSRLAHNYEALIAVLESIDGSEVPIRLSQKLAMLVGEEQRDEVFAGLEIPPIGATPASKNAFMRDLMGRLEGRVDDGALTATLTSGLHYEPPEVFSEERQRYLEAPDIDSFIRDEHRRYLEFLTGIKDEGSLYYTQPITDTVIAWVADTPTCGPGLRRGNEIYITKIPYQADEYLHETDGIRKRYLCCHCPWARESILHPGAEVPARFCECSAGFEKQYWDAVLGQAVQVEVAGSALRGDLVCEFVVHLPAGLIGQAERPS